MKTKNEKKLSEFRKQEEELTKRWSTIEFKSANGLKTPLEILKVPIILSKESDKCPNCGQSIIEFDSIHFNTKTNRIESLEFADGEKIEL